MEPIRNCAPSRQPAEERDEPGHALESPRDTGSVAAGGLERLFRAWHPDTADRDALAFADPLTSDPPGHRRMYERLGVFADGGGPR